MYVPRMNVRFVPQSRMCTIRVRPCQKCYRKSLLKVGSCGTGCIGAASFTTDVAVGVARELPGRCAGADAAAHVRARGLGDAVAPLRARCDLTRVVAAR